MAHMSSNTPSNIFPTPQKSYAKFLNPLKYPPFVHIVQGRKHWDNFLKSSALPPNIAQCGGGGKYVFGGILIFLWLRKFQAPQPRQSTSTSGSVTNTEGTDACRHNINNLWSFLAVSGVLNSPFWPEIWYDHFGGFRGLKQMKLGCFWGL